MIKLASAALLLSLAAVACTGSSGNPTDASIDAVGDPPFGGNDCGVPEQPCGAAPDVTPLLGTWTLAIAEDGVQTPCPAFQERTALQLVATEDVGEHLVLTSEDGREISDLKLVGADVATSEIQLVLHDFWGSLDGMDVYPQLAFDLNVHDGVVDGVADTSFNWDTPTAGTTCRFHYAVHGTIAP